MASNLIQHVSNIFHPLFGPNPDISTIVTSIALGAIGAIVLPASASLLSWIRLHFLHRSKIARYHHTHSSAATSNTSLKSSSSSSTKTSLNNACPWALVTGASDGIGAAFTSELARHDFNVLLHGRNASKLDAQITLLRQSHPHLVFEKWICDVTRREDWDGAFIALQQIITENDMHLTVLVNNVGGNPDPDKSFTNLQHYDAATVNALVDMNVTFTAQITRVLLPVLIRSRPALVLTMSSIAAQQPIPYLGLYAGAKAFDLQFSRALRLEVMAEGLSGDDGIEVLGVTAARVKSAGAGDVEVSWITPSSADFARSVLGLVGCGRDEVCGWWSHDVQIWAMGLLPVWLAEWLLVKVAREEKRWREQGEKKK